MQPFRAAVRAGLVLTVAGGLLAGCSSSDDNASKASTTTRPAPTATTTPKQAAEALTQTLLDDVVLPPGAKESDAPLPELMRAPFSTPAIGNLVQARRVWSVPGDPKEIAQFLDAHRPGGLTPSGLGYSKSPTSRVWVVDNQIPDPPPNTSYEDLQMSVGDGGNGNALIRADAVVGWTEPRPAEQFVSAHDRFVTVTVVHTDGSTGKRVVTSDPELVDPMVRSFNKMTVAAPDAIHSCPPIGPNSVTYRVAFSKSATAAPDLVATLSKCGGISVTVRGHPATGLVGVSAATFSNDVARVLGFAEPHFG